VSVILQRCRRTGALAEDCGGNFTCDNSCDLEDVEFVLADEYNQLRAALDRIAHQGLGHFDYERREMMGDTGEPWEHWAHIAHEALAPSTERD
jgi:hypothetical protein